MIRLVRVRPLLVAVIFFAMPPLAAQADDPCQGADNCIQVLDIDSLESPYGDLSAELQAAWNSLAYGPEGHTDHTRIVLYPPPAQASGSPRYRLDKRVRFCWDSSLPSGSDEPICAGSGPLPTIEFAGLWDLECNLDSLQTPLQSSDYCLWIGDAWNDGFENLLDVTGRIRIHQTHDWLLGSRVVPFFCDGCTGAGPLRYEQTWASTIAGSGPCGVFAGGPKRIDLDCQIAGPTLDGLHDPPTVIAGQVGRGSWINSRTQFGTGGEAFTWGDADGCSYGAGLAYDEYPCHLVIAEDSEFATDLRTYGPIGTLTIYGAIRARGKKAVILHGEKDLPTTPFEAIRIFGRLTSAWGPNSVIRIAGNDVAELDPLPTIVIDGAIYDPRTSDNVGPAEATMLSMGCAPTNEDLPIIHIGPHARFQVASDSAATHWLREGHRCGIRAWNEESVVVSDDVSDSGDDPGGAQCWNWYSEDWDSCSNPETYWYHPHQAPKVFVTRGQVVVHRPPCSEPPCSETSCNLRWLRNGSLLGGEIFELGGDELDEAGERLARMLSAGVEGDAEYLQLEIDSPVGGGCWPNKDWGAFEVRLEMHEENFHRDAP